ncbi:MAG: hypothetical protein ACRENU_04635 [Gemmatimonadaceae bacterium]
MKPIRASFSLLVAACSVSTAPRPETVSSAGVLRAEQSLALDAGVSDVTFHVGAERDSVRWTLRTDPAGCARADVTSFRLGITNRARKCATTWVVSAPAIADVSVRVSVGNITLDAPADRAIQLDAGVGNLKLRLDGRELRHSGAPGSGDELELGDPSTLPRLIARTSVGSITLDLRTAR